MASVATSANQKTLRRSLFGGGVSSAGPGKPPTNNGNDENVAPGPDCRQVFPRGDIPDDDDLDLMMMEEMMSQNISENSTTSAKPSYVTSTQGKNIKCGSKMSRKHSCCYENVSFELVFSSRLRKTQEFVHVLWTV